MEACGDSCPRGGPVEVDERVIQAAEKLACLLADTAEFQNLVRMSRAVQLDRQVAGLMRQLEGAAVADQSAPSSEALENQLESLEIVREYRQSEKDARGIFSAVEAAISGAAGLAFAEHAKPSACS